MYAVGKPSSRWTTTRAVHLTASQHRVELSAAGDYSSLDPLIDLLIALNGKEKTCHLSRCLSYTMLVQMRTLSIF